MKKIFNKAIMNKAAIGLLGLALSIIAAGAINTDGSQVLAATGDNVVDAVDKDYLTVEYTADTAKTKIGKETPDQPTLAGYEDWLFSGWYSNEKCTSPIRTADAVTDPCYAKFVPTDVLSVKCQVLSGTTASSDKTNMRFTTSIDTNQYLNVGFEVSRAGKPYTYETQYAYQRIEASATAKVAFEYSPKVIDTKSEAFVTYTIKNIPNTEGNKYFDTIFMAKPYWTTWDGVRVYGVTKYAAVEDSYSDVVNIPVKVTASETVYTDADFSVVESDNTTKETISAVRYNKNENYAAVIMSGKTSLASATKYTVTHAERESVYIHRNLETKYEGTEGTADRTWYDVYVDENDNLTEDEFVVATNADLYGLSYIIMRDGFTFADKKIYVVSDIVVNKGRAADDGWYEVEEDGVTAIEDATSYGWSKIGTATYPFEGLFDGQGHTISGVVYEEDEAYLGLFGKTAYGSKVQNLQLKNSYFEYKGTSTGYVYVGSIAGWGNGNFESIKSEAIVLTSAGGKGFGGIIGYKDADGDITDCWYAGQLSLGSEGIQGGGIVGAIRGGATVNMKYCHNGGTLTSTTTAANGSGGLCGFMEAQSYLTVENCLSTGSISCTNNWHGSIIGRLNDSTITIDNTYSIQTDGCQRAVRYGSGTIIYNGTTYTTNLSAADYGVPIENLLGCDGYYNDTIALDFVNYWGPVIGGTPELLTFSDNALDVWDGKGTETLPWMIYTKKELETLSILAEATYDFSGKHIKLGADITVVKGDSAEEVKANATDDDIWTPIGTSSNGFAGNFNGDKHTINGIYLVSSKTYQGLFGYTATGCEISNFELTNSYFESTATTGNGWIGSIVGCLHGKCDTVKSDATVVSNTGNSGGMIGVVYNPGSAIINNCWFAGNLTLGSSTTQCGGVVGAIRLSTGYTASITNCLNTGTITGSNGQIGGICGVWTAGDAGSLTISNCVNARNVDATKNHSGGIIGRTTITGLEIKDSYVIKETEEDTAYIYRSGTVTLTNSEIKTNDEVQGNNGWYNTTLDFDTYWRAVEGVVPQLDSFADGTKLPTWKGKGTETSPWIISDKAELEFLSTLAKTYDFSGKHIQLGTDEQAGELTIIVNEGTVEEIKENNPTNWAPIGLSNKAFNGIFDGNGNTISGLYYNGDGTYVGLFAVTGNNAEVKDLKIANSYFESNATGTVYIGSVAGVGYGAFENIKSEAEIACYGQYIGGLVGSVWRYGSATFNNCWFDGKLRVEGASAEKCGGILGGLNTTGDYKVDINNCLNSGFINISSLSDEKVRVGGICGFVQTVANITNCLNATSFTTYRARVAAIVGDAYYGSVLTLQNVYAITGDGADGTYNSSDYCGHICEAEGDNEAATVTLVDNSWAKLTAEQLAGTNAETHASALFTTENSPWITGDLYPVLNILGEIGMSIPEMTVASADSTTVTTLTGDGNFVKQIMATTRTEYENYLTSLETAGFEKYAYNVDDENCATSSTVLCGTYAKDNLILNATYFVSEGRTSISYYEGALSEHLISGDTTEDAGYETTLSMLEMFHYGNSFVIQLKNGHFIVSDGGMGDELIYLIEYLESLVGKDTEGNQIVPVIEAWFITHAHGDHTGALNSFWNAGKRELVNRVCVEGVYYSSPSDDEVLSISGCQTVDYGIARVTNCLLRNQVGEPTPLYRPQTGQRYYFNNEVTIDIMLAQEQLEMNADKTTEVGAMRANLNSSSTVSLVTIDGQTCLLPGDLQEAGFDILFANYDATLFSTLDFFALNHHGFNTSRTIAEKVTAQTILKTVKDATPVRCETAIQTLCDKATESVAWGNGTVVFTFPYTPDKTIPTYDVWALNSWAWKDTTEPKYHDYSERQEQENIDKGTDGTTDEEFE